MATPTRRVGAPTLDFFVVGAAKAGTTALHHLLRTHPELCLPEGKELPYFVTPRHAYYESPAEFFADAFEHRGEGQLCGTVTPQYLYGALLGPDRSATASDSPETTIPGRIRDAYPGAKLIAILRDPVARARSHHRMSTMRGIEQRPFDLAIDELLSPDALAESRLRPDETNGYVALGEYGRLLGGYLDVFPREQLLVLFQGDLEEDPGAVCAEVFAFLGVDSSFRPPNLGSRYHDGGSHRRFAWLDLTSWQRAARRSALLSGLWRRVPRSQRRRLLRRFNLVSRRLFLWNRVAVDAAAEPDAPSAETLARLRTHYREDGGCLRELLGAAPPWSEPERPA
ncbi:MAG TPA: sulfotransferase [Solirubrobacterales bacterium]